jgi:HAE1 family hydrophobic/amphiphilic exporter-1
LLFSALVIGSCRFGNSVLVTKLFGNKQQVKLTKTIQFNWYSSFLDKVLNARWVVISLAAISIVVAALLIPHIGSEFMPRTSAKNFSIEMRFA